MIETISDLESIQPYSAREFENPQYLLDFVGVGHNRLMSEREGLDALQIWLVARVIEVDKFTLEKETDLNGWARSHAEEAVLRRFPIKDFSQIREGQLVFWSTQSAPQKQSFKKYTLMVDPASCVNVCIQNETKSKIRLIRKTEDSWVDEFGFVPRLHLSAKQQTISESGRTKLGETVNLLLSPAELFWLYFHKSLYLVECLFEGATKPVMSRIFTRPPQIFGDRLVCTLVEGSKTKEISAAIVLANFRVSGGYSEDYIKKIGTMMLKAPRNTHQAYAPFPEFLPFTEPFLIEVIARQVSIIDPDHDEGIETATERTRALTAEALQCLQIISIEPYQCVSELTFVGRKQMSKHFNFDTSGELNRPVEGFVSETDLVAPHTVPPAPEFAMRFADKVDHEKPAADQETADQDTKDQESAEQISSGKADQSDSMDKVKTAEELVCHAKKLFAENLKVQFERIRPILGQAPSNEYRSTVFNYLGLGQAHDYTSGNLWLNDEIGAPISKTVSTLHKLVERDGAKVWTLGGGWYPLKRLQSKVALIELPETWSEDDCFRKVQRDRQLYAMVAKLLFHKTTFYLFCVEHQLLSDGRLLNLENFLIRPENEVWVGRDVLMDILYTGVRHPQNGGPEGWPRPEELIGIARCIPYSFEEQDEVAKAGKSDLLDEVNTQDHSSHS